MADEEKIQQKAVALALLAILDGTVDTIGKAVAETDPPLSTTQLAFLRAAEAAGTKPRKGVLAAIDAEAERRDATVRAGHEEAERAALEEADAKLLRFAVGEKLPAGADAAAAAKTGATFLVLGDGTREIAGLNRIAAGPGDFAGGGAAALYTRPINIDSSGLGKQFLHAVALIDDEGTLHGVCEIPAGIHLGGKIELPANSLIFG